MNRFVTLVRMYQAFKETGIYLLINENGKYGIPTAADDWGYFLYSMIISHYLQVSAVIGSNLLFYFLALIPMAIMGLSFLFFSSSIVGIIFTFIALFRLWMPLVSLNPVYIVYFSSCCLIPLFLFFEKTRSFRLLSIVSVIAGLFCCMCNQIRIFSALPAIIFLLIYIFGNSFIKIKQKFFLILLFCVGYAPLKYHYNYQLNRRNIFLLENKASLVSREGHVFWHNIYIGFGFLNNDYGIKWADRCGDTAALAVDIQAKYPSKLYEETVKGLVFKLFKEKRYFVATTIFAKLGVILYFFLIYFGLFGVLASWFYPKPWYVELAFWGALGVSALPGILTIPVVAYLVGFISCTVIYAIYSIIWALDQGAVLNMKNSTQKLLSIIKGN